MLAAPIHGRGQHCSHENMALYLELIVDLGYNYPRYAGLAQLFRARPCQGRGRGLESPDPHQKGLFLIGMVFFVTLKYMKLLLCSEGFHTPNTVQACAELVGKPQNEITVAIINEAYAVERGDKRWVLNNLNDVAKNFPAEIDIVSLFALSIEEIEARIMQKDVIFVVGGNTDYQMHVFQKSGFAKLLPKLLETKVYVGSSAGSMVIGKKVSSESYHTIYGERQTFGVEAYLGLVDFAIKPHMNSPHWPKNTPEVLDKAAAGMDFPVYGLQDDSAIIVNGNSVKFIGSSPHEVGRKVTGLKKK